MSRKKVIDDNDIAIMIQGQNEVHKKRKELNKKMDKEMELLDHMTIYKKKYGLKRGDPVLSEISKKITDGSITTKSEIDKYFNKSTKEPPLKKIKGLIENIELHPKQPKTKKHTTADSILKTIFDIKDTDFKDYGKPDFTKGNELIKQIEERIKSKKPIRKDIVDRMADLIQSQPEFKNITKNKLKKYGYEIFNNFNKRYPKLLNELFTKEEIEKLLKKKYEKHLKMK